VRSPTRLTDDVSRPASDVIHRKLLGNVARKRVRLRSLDFSMKRATARQPSLAHERLRGRSGERVYLAVARRIDHVVERRLVEAAGIEPASENLPP